MLNRDFSAGVPGTSNASRGAAVSLWPIVNWVTRFRQPSPKQTLSASSARPRLPSYRRNPVMLRDHIWKAQSDRIIYFLLADYLEAAEQTDGKSRPAIEATLRILVACVMPAAIAGTPKRTCAGI